MLRTRSRPSAPALSRAWVRPHWMEVAAGEAAVNLDHRRWTVVGNLDSPLRARVDRRGLLAVESSRWSLDWWIGAEDRWHVPSREVSTRQALVGATPVVETRLRVPGGDAVHRVFAARDAAGAEAVVVEIENHTSVPFAVAIALRPYDLDGVGAVHEVAAEGAALLVDGRTAVAFSRPPRHAVAGSGEDGDVAELVFSGRATGTPPARASSRDGLAQVAVLFPLAHTATLRVVVPLDDPATDVADLAASAQVVSGWQAHAGRGVRVEVPDRRLQGAVDSSIAHLLLRPAGVAEAAALDRFGFHDVAATTLPAHAASLVAARDPAEALGALLEHWTSARDAEVATELAPVVAALVTRLRDPARGRWRRRATASVMPSQEQRRVWLAIAEELFEAAGERRAAQDARHTAGALRAAPAGTTASEPAALVVSDAAVHDASGRPSPVATLHAARQELAEGDARALARLAWALGTATATWSWPTGLDAGGTGGVGDGHDPAANAALLRLVRDLLVLERLTPSGAVLDLCPIVPDAWLGQGWELHDAPTRHGRLSYAVRWHGDRPALLWEVEPVPGVPPVRLTASGLDPSWSSSHPSGEALLTPVPIPERSPRRGLGIPVSIEPAPGGGR